MAEPWPVDGRHAESLIVCETLRRRNAALEEAVRALSSKAIEEICLGEGACSLHLPAVVEILRLRSQSESGCLSALLCIAQSAAKGDGACVTDGAEAVVAAMKMHAGKAFIATAGCGALRSLAAAPENCMRLMTAGAIEAVVAAMHDHAGDAATQRAGCSALAEMAVVPEAQGRVEQAGAVALIIMAMSLHGDAGVQHQGCWALANVAVLEVNKEKIVAAGGIRALMGALRCTKDDEDVQALGLRALANVTVLDLAAQALAVAEGAREAAENALRRHECTAAVQEQGLRLLRVLSRVQASQRQEPQGEGSLE